MADFSTAYAFMVDLERGRKGGYANDPRDLGGETYDGIARKFWPNWDGWRTIDGAKAFSDFPANLERPPLRAILVELVADFYRLNFWEAYDLGELPQAVATEMLDQTVNMGRQRPFQNLQQCLNALNNGGKLWPDIPVDGMNGPRTTGAARSCERAGRTKALVKYLNCLQGAYYVASKQEWAINGWANRITA